MKILSRYTLNTLRRNKHTSLSIMAAILLASTLLYSLCSYAYTQWRWRVDIEYHDSGNWHAELGGYITPDMLETAEHNIHVKKTMVKGPFCAVQLPQGSSLPYLLLRDADQNYWEEMGEKNAVLEGRTPQRPGEVVVSKSFFERNPQFAVGDTVTLPVGQRIFHNEVLDVGIRQEGETFVPDGEITITFVGSLDATTATTVPGYYAMGFLDRSSLLPTDETVVYLQMKNIRDTYTEVPLIAKELGLEANEYGEYENNFRYHKELLSLNGVFDPNLPFDITNYINIMVYVVLVLLTAGAFVFIIHNAFSLSANARIKQLGMFRSVGATPAQIRKSILLEGVILSVLPILLSIVTGHLFTLLIFEIYQKIGGDLIYFPVTVHFSLPIALIAALVSLITVLISAFIPARKMAKLSPIEAIRSPEQAVKLRKSKHHRIFSKLFGFSGELAAVSYRAYRRSFRSCITSMTLCLLLLTGFFCTLAMSDCLSDRNRRSNYYNISGRLQILGEPDPQLLNAIGELPKVEEQTYYVTDTVALWVTPEQQSEPFTQAGGFADVDQMRFPLIERDGKYRIPVQLFGLEPKFFDEYCRSVGDDPKKYYDTENPQALALSWAPRYPDITNNAEKASQFYPLLNLSQNQELVLEEKTKDSMETDYRFSVHIGAIASAPPQLDYHNYNYQLMLYFPIDTYYSIVQNFLPEYSAGSYRLYLSLKTQPQDDLAVTKQLRQLCESTLSTEDVTVYSNEEDRQNNAVMSKAMDFVVNGIGLLLGLIGVSNAISSVHNSLRQRRKEFAMLRSVGMDFAEIKRLLRLEALRMMISPVMITVPILVIYLAAMSVPVDLSLAEFLPFLPVGKILLSILSVMAAIGGSYLISSRNIRNDTIIDALREENI